MKKVIKKFVNNNIYLVRWLLGVFIRLQNYSYKKITEYSSILNNGFNPKHNITHYHDYFLSHIDPNDTVLDIGCGVGYLAFNVATKAERVVGIDISKPNISIAISRYQRGNLEFICDDATKYQFLGRFDKLILSNVLEHIADRVALLQKISVLGDVLLLRVPMVTRDWMTVYKKEHGYSYKLDDTHETEYTLEQVFQETKLGGWEVISYQVNWGEFWGVFKVKK